MTTRLSLELLSLDLRHACRRLAKHRAFAVVSIISLALGIGANTAAFTVLHAVMLRELPVKDPDTLALVSMQYTGSQYSMSYPAYAHLRDRSTSSSGIVAFRAQPLNVSADGSTDRVTGMLVSGNYFGVLGVRTPLGSPIGPDDDRTPRSGGARGLVAVLSHQYWTRRFGADPAVVGRAVGVNGRPATIVGVAPSAFRGTRVGSLPDVFIPMMFAAEIYGDRWLPNPQNNWLRIIARVRPGVDLTAAESELTVAFRQFNNEQIVPLATTDAARQRAKSGVILLEPGSTGMLEMGTTVKPSLRILMGLVLLVLAIACANVASLLVARAERQQRDTAIALALGATRGRIWSQTLVESLLVSCCGVGLGLAIAHWLRSLVVQLVPANQELDVSLDGRVLAVAIGIGLTTALLLTAATAWQSGRLGVVRALKGEDVRARARLRRGLIVGQLALSVVVLASASLFGRTLTTLRLVDPGFDRERVLIASTAPSGYPPERLTTFHDRLLEDVRAIPGVSAAAMAAHEPLSLDTYWTIMVRRDPSAPPQRASTAVTFVSPGYFDTMGIPLVRGRDFRAGDEAGSPRRVIVDQRFVSSHLGGGDPLGQQIVGNGQMTFEIVGVARDAASVGLRRRNVPVMYLAGDGGIIGGGVLHVRAAVPPAALTSAIQDAVRRLDPAVPVFGVRTIGDQLDRHMGRERTFAALSSAFGVLALALSSVGLYAVIAHAVARRTRELGIRLALGAGTNRIVRLILVDAGVLVALGLGLGLPSAYAIARGFGSVLYGVQPGDVQSLAIAVAVLIAAAAAAAWLPARRAARVDPLIALRTE